MKKLARAPAMSESVKALAVSHAETLTGSLTAVAAAVASFAKAGVRFICQGVDTGMERNPSP